ncbi:MAG TPA: CapA family protein [Candidatus Paceibacterota bacterium]
MHQFYKYLTIILLFTAAIIGPVLFFVYRFSSPPRTEQVTVVFPKENPRSAEAGPEAPATPKQKPIKILVLGDIMLGRAVRTMYEKNGPGYLLGNAGNILFENDIAWANLEGPLLYSPTATPIDGMRFAFATSSLAILKNANIGFLNLANNHGLDQGRAGLEETVKILKENEFMFMGDPAKIGPESLATTTIGETSFALLGFNATWPTFKLDEAVKLVGEIKNSSSGLVLVTIHWGEEYQPTHNASQEKIARALIDAGAEVIFGHHPHVVQDIGQYRDKYIFYSLGNFIFDQWFSEDAQEELAVQMNILDGNISYRLLPCRSTKSAVTPMSDTEEKAWLLDFSGRNPQELRAFIQAGILER